MIQEKKISEPQSLYSAPLNVHDLRPFFTKFLTPQAIKALNNKTGDHVYQYNEIVPNSGDGSYKDMLINLLKKFELKTAEDYQHQGNYIRKLALVKSFGITCNQTNIVAASLKLVDVINSLAKHNYIKASLMDLGMLELYNEDPNSKKFVIFSYLAITDEHSKEVDNIFNNYIFPEGGIPMEFK